MKNILLLLLTFQVIAEEMKGQGLSEENIHDLGLMLKTKPSPAQQQAIQLNQQWQGELNRSLTESKNPYLLSLALHRMVSADRVSQGLNLIRESEHESRLPAEIIAQSINTLVEQAPELRPETMALLESVCFYKHILEFCDKPLIINKRIQHDPQNLISYFKPLSLSIQEQDKEKITKIFKHMSQAAFSDAYQYLLPSFRAHIEQFAANTPMPQSAVDNELAFYMNLKSPTQEAKASRQKHMREEMLYLIEVSAKLSMAIPNYRTLLTACENQPEHHDACLKVAETMINNSRDDISTVIGHKLKIQVLEDRSDTQAAQQAQASFDEYQSIRQCLLDYISERRFEDVLKGIEMDRIGNDPSRKEIDNFIKQTQYIYHQRKDSESIKDPAYCLAD